VELAEAVDILSHELAIDVGSGAWRGAACERRHADDDRHDDRELARLGRARSRAVATENIIRPGANA
jgi:hypothetical protein